MVAQRIVPTESPDATTKQIEAEAQLSATTSLVANGIVRRISHEDALAMFDARTKHELGIPGDEFVTKYENGDYNNADDETADRVNRLVMLLPFVYAR